MIYDIDRAGTYSKTIKQLDFDGLDDWLDRVQKQRFKLTYGIFRDPEGRFYTAKFKKIDLSKSLRNDTLSLTTDRVIKFKWSYIPLG